MPQITKLFGPPGTGKTTTLIGKVEEALGKGISGQKIAYLSFSTKAATEAATRAMSKFNLTKADLPWFKTIHALCFNRLKMDTQQIMKRGNYTEICEKLGLRYSGFMVMEEGQIMAGAEVGDRMLFNEGLARVRCITYAEQYRLSNEDYSKEEFLRFCESVRAYKQLWSLFDFNDMLQRFIDSPPISPQFDLLIIDEAQDLSELQWLVVDRLVRNSSIVYIAGDDDQAIFKWAGAAPETFIKYPGEQIVLDQSYRLPEAVHKLSQDVIHKCDERVQKDFKPTDKSGSVHWVYMDELEDDMGNQESGTWLVLARNAYLLKPFEEMCERAGYPYDSKNSPLRQDYANVIVNYERVRNGHEVSPKMLSDIAKYMDSAEESPTSVWYDGLTKLGADIKDYFRLALSRGESITAQPRITLTTIHGAKGGEADNVVLILDMSYKSFTEYQDNPNDEIRVFYVGITRTKKRLYLLQPKTTNFFNI
jgi:DNA helicase-2/ATP-dependent DNA helicase PcrA